MLLLTHTRFLLPHRYHLIPIGSYSRIKSLEDQTEFELYVNQVALEGTHSNQFLSLLDYYVLKKVRHRRLHNNQAHSIWSGADLR